MGCITLGHFDAELGPRSDHSTWQQHDFIGCEPKEKICHRFGWKPRMVQRPGRRSSHSRLWLLSRRLLKLGSSPFRSRKRPISLSTDHSRWRLEVRLLHAVEGIRATTTKSLKIECAWFPGGDEKDSWLGWLQVDCRDHRRRGGVQFSWTEENI